MTRPLREARIDLSAIAGNVETLRRRVGTARVMAVVKADGYGHGAVPAARAALEGGADHLGVADLAEALELRAAGVDAPLLAWLLDPDADVRTAVEAGAGIGVSSLRQLENVARADSASVHLKVDTGLGRNGLPLDDCPAVFARAAELQRTGRIRVDGVFSHLANAGPEEDAAQVTAFERALGEASAAGLEPDIRHLASTAGALRVPDARYDMVRLGIGIYGLSPFDDESAAELGLRAALELSAPVVSVKRVAAGSGVSYGYDHRTASETTLALVPLGYADGVPRHASGRGPVSIAGRRYRVAGRVAMDQFVVDVGDDEVRVGDRAVLFADAGSGAPTADDWAASAGTIGYEIITRLGRRVERTYAP